ncbi:unnamed protein product [Caenorhabditis brenneri]
MKLLLLFLLPILYTPTIHAGLSAYERKKLIDELNYDRAAVGKKLGMTFGKVSYNTTLEKQLDSLEVCGLQLFPNYPSDDNPYIIPLEYNNIAKEYWEKDGQKHKQFLVMGLFNLDDHSIGCSKTYECSEKIGDGRDTPKGMAGKTMEFRGACVTDSKWRKVDMAVRNKIGYSGLLPDPGKYGKLIGVKPFEK